MNTIVSIGLFVVGLGLVIYFAEKLVKGAVGTSLGFGVSTFLISVIFIGFDPLHQLFTKDHHISLSNLSKHHFFPPLIR